MTIPALEFNFSNKQPSKGDVCLLEGNEVIKGGI